MMVIPPSQPRRLATVTFGIGNVIIGLSYFTSGKTPVTANLFGPIWVWGLVYVLLGIAIYASSKSLTRAYFTALLSVGWWVFVSILLLMAVNSPVDLFHAPHSPIVTIRSPILGLVIAFWHTVLIPYWRKPYR